MVAAVKIWSQKQCQKIKNLLCLKNLMQRLPEVIKRKTEYRAEAIGQCKAILKFSKAMEKDPLHKKITDTAKRLRDEDDFDEDDALKYAIKKRRYLLDGKLEEFDPPTYCLGEYNESDSLQQSSGSKYAPSQRQQNNSGSYYTQSQLPKRPWINA